MDKTTLLNDIQISAAEGSVTIEELVEAYHLGTGAVSSGVIISQSEQPKEDPALKKHLSIGDIFYYLGGGIVFIGIAILISGSWDTLNSFTKILVTLGVAVIAYIIGVLLSQVEKYEGVAQACYLISALVAPVGLYVTLYLAGMDHNSVGVQVIMTFILLGTYGTSALIYRKTIFLVFTILFGTWFFYALTSMIVGSNPVITYNFYLYQTLLTGLSYVLLGYYLAGSDHREGLSKVLYGFGILGFLSSALALGGFFPHANYFWELIFPILVFGIIYLSVTIKSRAFLVWGTIFLMAYILKITGEYFSKGLSWPVALVIAGLLLIGVGYYSVYLGKRITNSKTG